MDAMDSRLLRMLRSEVEQAMQAKRQTIASGGLQSFEAYREQCGELRGMAGVLSMAEELESRINGKEER